MSYLAGDTPQLAAALNLPVPFLERPVSVPIGSAIAAMTEYVGIPSCLPCERRKQALNQLLAFRPWGSQ